MYSYHIIIVFLLSAYLSFGSEFELSNSSHCNINATSLVINDDITICLPQTICAPETCPPQLGKCISNSQCLFLNDYKGIQTFPVPYATYYCQLNAGGCHGVTQNNFPEINAVQIASNLKMTVCDNVEPNVSIDGCVGVAASSPMVVGNSQETKDSNGHIIYLWGQGMTEYTGICYELIGLSNKKVVVALTDRCGGYCTCQGIGPQECGPCINALDMQPNCPCVGFVPGLFTNCCGLSNYGCELTEQTCDWCSSNNHLHFDLDIATYNYVSDGQGALGSIVLKSVRPVTCMTPLDWPPSSGGSSFYVPCPPDTWDVGSLASSESCQSGMYLKPGDSIWLNSENANHWCCVTTNIQNETTTINDTPYTSYIPCPIGSWDTGSLGPSESCPSKMYLEPGDDSWFDSIQSDHWCCLNDNRTTEEDYKTEYIPCPYGYWDTGSLGPISSCTSGVYMNTTDRNWLNSEKANHWCCKAF